MAQTSLFPHISAQPSRRGRRVPLHPRRPLVQFDDTAHAKALRLDEKVRGTGRARERIFREALHAYAADFAHVMPPLLYELVMDHLTRTDGQGLSLCFNGPLRQEMLVQVQRWLDMADAPTARARWQALCASQQGEERL